jgi:hypothetical protein
MFRSVSALPLVTQSRNHRLAAGLSLSGEERTWTTGEWDFRF